MQQAKVAPRAAGRPAVEKEEATLARPKHEEQQAEQPTEQQLTEQQTSRSIRQSRSTEHSNKQSNVESSRAAAQSDCPEPKLSRNHQ